MRLNSTNFPLLHEKGKQLDLPKYEKCSCRAWLQAKLLRALVIEHLMKEAQFFPCSAPITKRIACYAPYHAEEMKDNEDQLRELLSSVPGIIL